MEGLNDGLQSQLLAHTFDSFQSLVDKALLIDNKHREIQEKKRKFQSQPSMSNHHPCLTHHQSSSSMNYVPDQLNYQSQPSYQAYVPSQYQTSNSSTKNNTLNAPVARNNNCYRCGESGHFTKQCPKNMAYKGKTKSKKTKSQLICSEDQRQHDLLSGKVNYLSARSAIEAPDVVFGTILVNSRSATVLFDSSATQSFIAHSFVKKYGIPTCLLKKHMVVSSPSGEVQATMRCPSISLKIRGVEFLANPVVLKTLEIDVILGKDWLEP
jgi:hypothetical protein